jgi:hypothetical protein
VEKVLGLLNIAANRVLRERHLRASRVEAN